jgi:putative ABC transport system permease protein
MKALLQDALRALRQSGQLLGALGLMLGLAALLITGQMAWRLADTDPAMPDAERIVLLDFKGNMPGFESPWFTASPVVFADWLKQRQLPLELISRTSKDSLPLRVGGAMESVPILLADPEWVTLFGLRALHGDLAMVMASRDQLAITPRLVRRLWGELPLEKAIGRELESRGLRYRIGAVIPQPDPRSPQAKHELLAGYGNQANAHSPEYLQEVFLINGRVFAKLRPGVSAAAVGGWMREAFMASPGYAQLPADWKAGREPAHFRGLTITHLPFEGQANELRWVQVGALGAAALLLLLLATVNVANLQAASMLQRQRETALRRALGADLGGLLRLWAAELLLPLLLAGLGALLLAWWGLPVLAGWMGLQLPAFPEPPLIALLGLVLLALLPLLLAAPAWLALRRPPAPALQGRTASDGPWGRRLRQGLLALQLGGALLLLALTGVLALQYRHLLQLDRGFATENRLVMSLQAEPDQAHLAAPLLAQLQQHPAVRHFAMSDNAPARDQRGTIDLHVSDTTRQRQVLRVSRVTPGYFDTYGMRVLAGDAKRFVGGEPSLVIDARAAKLLGFANPQDAVGQLLRGNGGHLQEGQEQRRVIAVVGAVKLESAREQPMPQAYLVSEQPQSELTLFGPDLPALRAAVEKIWTAMGAPLVVQLASAEEQLEEAYQQEGQMSGLIAGVALLAVGVAALGAYALVADTLRRRRREIVLHRLHGANGMAVAGVVAREFAPPLAAALLVALPAAAWLGQLYLAGFVDRVAPALGLALPMSAATLLLVAVTLLAALRHLRLALALRPIEALA